MLYADDAGLVSRSPEGLAKMMAFIVQNVCGRQLDRARKGYGDAAVASAGQTAKTREASTVILPEAVY